MLNAFAKFLLVATSLSPVLGAIAVRQIANNAPWSHWAPWLAVAILLVFVCWALLRYAAKSAQAHHFQIMEFESSDQEVLAFLLAYLLPFVSSDAVGFTGEWLTGVYIFLIIIMVITHAGAFHFNPVMSLLGYHFYSVKNDEGVSHLLISREELRRAGTELKTVRLGRNIYLHIGGRNA